MQKKKKSFQLPEKLIDQLDEIMNEEEESEDHPIHERFVKEGKILKRKK
ncbi:MAG: hypothetical protein QW331_04545 [Candidatus Woesearchaeota archaeon]